MMSAHSPAYSSTVETSPEFDTAWDRFVEAHPTIHHAQTAAWARAQRASNIESYIATCNTSATGEVLGGAVVIVRTIRGAGRVGYIDRGPVFAREADRHQVLDAVMDSVRSQRLSMLVLQPADGDFATARILRDRGFGTTHFKTSLGATVKVDLTHGDADIVLSSMKSKTRSNVRKALRSPLRFRSATTSADIDSFHQLLRATADRQGFTAPSNSFLHGVIDHLGDRWARIMLVELDGRAVSGMLAMTVGDSLVYKRGAWSGDAGEHRPNELLHWGALNWAIDEGKSSYDFDGLERAAMHTLGHDVVATQKPVSSVDRFKLGFGGEPVLLPDVLTNVPNPVIRLAYDRLFPAVAGNKVVKRQLKRIRQR
jgi:lipid II:glycine glycyltransferase (peptidoglycan interpeptide bridge formation enzyme)